MIRKLLCLLGWRKIKCLLNLHTPEIEIVGNPISGEQLCMFYTDYNDAIYSSCIINIFCKHCGKPLGKKFIIGKVLAKDLGLRK